MNEHNSEYAPDWLRQKIDALTPRIAVRLILITIALGLATNAYSAAIKNAIDAAKPAAGGPGAQGDVIQLLFTGLSGAPVVLPTLCFAHLIVHVVRYIHGTNALSYPRFRRHFEASTANKFITTALSTVAYLAISIAAANVTSPISFYAFFAAHLLFILVYLIVQRNFATAAGTEAREVQAKWGWITAVELTLVTALLCGAAWKPLWYDWIWGWGSTALMCVVFLDLLLMREVYFTAHDKKVFDSVYEVRASADFYDAVADEYDRRVSSTVQRVREDCFAIVRGLVQELRQKAPDRTIRVLEIGGGTGMLGSKFGQLPNIEYTNVDSSRRMIEVFRKVVGERPEFRHVLGSINDRQRREELTALLRGTVDIVITTYVLGSQASDPEFSCLDDLLAEGAYIVIADINPLRHEMNPYFDVAVGGKSHALRTRAVNISQMKQSLQSCGFVERTWHNRDSVDTGYPHSFVAVYERRASNLKREVAVPREAIPAALPRTPGVAS